MVPTSLQLTSSSLLKTKGRFVSSQSKDPALQPYSFQHVMTEVTAEMVPPVRFKRKDWSSTPFF